MGFPWSCKVLDLPLFVWLVRNSICTQVCIYLWYLYDGGCKEKILLIFKCFNKSEGVNFALNPYFTCVTLCISESYQR